MLLGCPAGVPVARVTSRRTRVPTLAPQLPPQALTSIAACLDTHSMLSMVLTCRTWATVTHEAGFWQTLMLRDFGWVAGGEERGVIVRGVAKRQPSAEVGSAAATDDDVAQDRHGTRVLPHNGGTVLHMAGRRASAATPPDLVVVEGVDMEQQRTSESASKEEAVAVHSSEALSAASCAQRTPCTADVWRRMYMKEYSVHQLTNRAVALQNARLAAIVAAYLPANVVRMVLDVLLYIIPYGLTSTALLTTMIMAAVQGDGTRTYALISILAPVVAIAACYVIGVYIQVCLRGCGCCNLLMECNLAEESVCFQQAQGNADSCAASAADACVDTSHRSTCAALSITCILLLLGVNVAVMPLLLNAKTAGAPQLEAAPWLLLLAPFYVCCMMISTLCALQLRKLGSHASIFLWFSCSLSAAFALTVLLLGVRWDAGGVSLRVTVAPFIAVLALGMAALLRRCLPPCVLLWRRQRTCTSLAELCSYAACIAILLGYIEWLLAFAAFAEVRTYAGSRRDMAAVSGFSSWGAAITPIAVPLGLLAAFHMRGACTALARSRTSVYVHTYAVDDDVPVHPAVKRRINPATRAEVNKLTVHVLV